MKHHLEVKLRSMLGALIGWMMCLGNAQAADFHQLRILIPTQTLGSGKIEPSLNLVPPGKTVPWLPALSWRVNKGLEVSTPSLIQLPGSHTALSGQIYLRLQANKSTLGVAYAF